MKTRLLDLSDLPKLMAVIGNKNTLGVSEANKEQFLDFETGNLEDLLRLGQETGSVFGAIDDSSGEDVLVGYLITCLSQAQPCYFVRKARTVDGAPLATLAELFTTAIKQHEAWGYKRFYVLYREKDVSLYRRLWRTSSTLNAYLAYTDLVVPTDLRPKHSDFWELLFGRTLYTEPMIVRGFLKIDDTTYLPESPL